MNLFTLARLTGVSALRRLDREDIEYAVGLMNNGERFSDVIRRVNSWGDDIEHADKMEGLAAVRFGQVS